MKKTFILVGALLLSIGCFAQNVTVKKGKVTMSESDYQALLDKAAKCDMLEAELAKPKTKKVELKTFIDSVSYAIGRDLYRHWDEQALGLNCESVSAALIDFSKGASSMDPSKDNDLLRRFQQSFEERERAKMQAGIENMGKTIEAGKKFLAENANSKQVRTTQSGLQYRVIQKGNGKRPTKDSQVKVHYTGTLIDGTKFDSSYDRGEPINFPVGAVIEGWQEGLQLMDEGSKYILYIPYNLAYGEQQAGIIPPGSTLIFEIELLEVTN